MNVSGCSCRNGNCTVILSNLCTLIEPDRRTKETNKNKSAGIKIINITNGELESFVNKDKLINCNWHS